MSEATPMVPTTEPQVSAWAMYRSMVGIGLVCGLLIVLVFQWTAPVIERNRAEALQRAIFQVLPEARASKTFHVVPGDRFEPFEGRAAGETLVYAGYDEGGTLVGLAIEASGMGYQDVIHVLYGYSFDKEAIVGIQVLESRETPGLGDKIESDPGFLANFERLEVKLTEDQSELAHPIVPVKHGEKTDPWQVDGITGATISSKAIAGLLDRSASWWVPRLRRNLDDFREAQP